MTFPDRIQQALDESAESYATPPSELETIIVRGRRRRLVARIFAGIGSGAALIVALAVTVSFTRAASEPEAIVGEQTEATLVENLATATEITAFGYLSEDAGGYTLVADNGSEQLRLVEAHSLQVKGEALFGPAISDGAGGFIYTVSDVIEGSDTRQGWVLWVPAGAASPIVIADEPEAGVGVALGVIDDGARYAVYTTVAGRTAQLRRSELSTRSAGSATTLLEDFAAGDAAADRIIMLGTADGCSTFTVLDGSGMVVPFGGLPTGPCPSLDQATLSPDGRRAAYLDRTGDRNRLVVVDLSTGGVDWTVNLDSRRRIVAFDGSEVTLTGDTTIDVATSTERQGATPAEQYEVRLNSRLVLQVPGSGDAVSFDEMQATPFAAVTAPNAVAGDDVDLFLEYSADGWTVAVRPDPNAAATAVDLDAFGVTLRGLGPYVLGSPIQRVADESGHELLSADPMRRCRTMRVSPLRGVTAEDVTLIVDNGRLAAVDFASSRFAFDGVTVGTSLADAIDRLADAEVAEQGGVTLLELELDETSSAEFRASGGAVTCFRITIDTPCG